MVLLWILAATIIVSLAAIVGVFSLFWSRKSLDKILLVLVGFSAGALLSGAFFHLLAEAIEETDSTLVFAIMFLGFALFFLIERFLHWHHCHQGVCDTHPVTYLILIGDGIHNFIDGLIIAASFLIGVEFGIITTIMIIGHEVPQEIGDFAVLIYGGFSRAKALFFNFISQATAILGGIIGFLMAAQTEFVVFLLPFAAGGFIYIAASDLIPELHKESNMKKSLVSFLFFLFGIAFLLGLKILFE